jgi:hypothetical protein
VFTLSDMPARIYWMNEFEELERKCNIFVIKLGLNPLNSGGMTYIEVDSPKIFFLENLECEAYAAYDKSS